METPKMPLDYIGITGKFGQQTSRYHYGLDLGWHEFRNRPVTACLSGKVIQCGYWSDAGNMIVISSNLEDKTIITRYLHLQNKPNFSVGSILEQGQEIGNMGNTGESTGEHLHFEYWICPLNYKFKLADKSKYAVDPTKYVYVYKDQEVSIGDKDKVLYYSPCDCDELNKRILDLEYQLETSKKHITDLLLSMDILESENKKLEEQMKILTNYEKIFAFGKYEIIKRN